MKLTSSVIQPGEPIPSKYTCDGEDSSPPLRWSDVPPNVQSLALIADDPDAPRGTFVHWVVWNIPSTVQSLEENLPKKASLSNGIKQGMTDFQKTGYGGPCPPSGTHRYFFKLYALDMTVDLPGNTTKADLEKAIEGHVLTKAELMGTYQRSS